MRQSVGRISILIILSLFVFNYKSFTQNSYERKEAAYIKKLSKLPESDVWETKINLTTRAHAKQTFGAVFLAVGLPSLIFGGIRSVKYKEESAYIMVGIGVAATAIGGILSVSSNSDKKKIIWVEKELHKRSSIKLTAGANGIRLLF